MLRRIWRWIDFKRRGIKVWGPCNIYPSASIGRNVSIGRFCEIGKDVKIGNNVRVGAYAFIPEGVTVCDNAFIGPHVCFTNDMYPPSPRNEWRETIVGAGAAIGAGATILPGVQIGIRAMVGAGSLVRRNIKPGELWVGNPARHIGYREKKNGD